VSKFKLILSKTNSSFTGNVLRLVSGTAGAQIIVLLIVPILTRYYLPKAFGIAAAFTSMTAIFSLISCLRYELAIVLPKCNRKAFSIFILCLICTLFFSLLIFLVAWTLGPLLLSLLNLHDVIPYLWLLPTAIFIGGVFNAVSYWRTRCKQFGIISVAHITNSLSSNGGRLAGCFVGSANQGILIITQVAGKLIAILVMLVPFIKYHSISSLNGAFDLKQIRDTAVRYKKFPLYSGWSALMNAVSWQLPVFMLGYYFSPAVVGYYALGFRILQLPMNVVGQAISKVFLQEAAQALNEGRLAPLVEKMYTLLVTFGLFPMLFLTFTGEYFYSLIFGNDWAIAGIYTQILSLWAFFWFISSPMAVLFSVLEKQEFGLFINILLLVTRFAALMIGGVLGDPKLALALFAASGVMVYGYQIISIMRCAEVKAHRFYYPLVRCAIVASPFLLIQAWLIFYTSNDILIISTGVLVFACYYGIQYRFEIMRYIKRIAGSS
jgi:lipopolysaccharide exporter